MLTVLAIAGRTVIVRTSDRKYFYLFDDGTRKRLEGELEYQAAVLKWGFWAVEPPMKVEGWKDVDLEEVDKRSEV